MNATPSSASTLTPTYPDGKRSGMAWVPRWRWSHPTLKGGVFDGFHSGVPAHVVNLSLNQLTHVTGITSASKLLTEFRLSSKSFNGKFRFKILNLDRLKKLYLLQNPRISGNVPSNTVKMTGLMEMEMYLTSLHDNIPSKFGMPKDLLYLGMDETHIHGLIPADLDNMHKIKHLSIESSQPNTHFYDFPGTSPVVVGFTHIVLLMLKGLTKYLLSYQVYLSCKITLMSLHDTSNQAPPPSYLHGYYSWFIKNN